MLLQSVFSLFYSILIRSVTKCEYITQNEQIMLSKQMQIELFGRLFNISFCIVLDKYWVTYEALGLSKSYDVCGTK